MNTQTYRPASLYEQVQQFVFREARLADQWQLDEWLALWAPQALYWVPVNHDDVDPQRELSLIYDDRQRLEMRIARIKSGMAWTQEPRSRMRRVLSNVELAVVPDGMLEVHSNFHLNELRPSTSTQVVWTGHTLHHLLPAGDGFQIALKKVLLLNNDEELPQLSIFL